MSRRLRIQVEGIVQGVGFRPFVSQLAHELGLGGWVRNTGSGVLVEVEGERVEEFARTLRDRPPPLARITGFESSDVPIRGETSFSILHSATGEGRRTGVSPDVATCTDCLRELFDPDDRRYRYPFINCTNCGPRYTIVRDVPYDRHLTTMASFPMCPLCRAEYENPADRRYHAQPVACPACGPRLALWGPEGAILEEDPLEGALARLRAGQVVAVKGLGGYHLACDARSEAAVAALRARKHREEKPFALMVRELDGLPAAEHELLAGVERPIVLVPRDRFSNIAPSVAPGRRELGVMLPYTPLHHLLMAELPGPIVLTSGNLSDEPIVARDTDAVPRLGKIAEAFLVHDRAIAIRVDDSVTRCFRGRPMPLRRSRGYAPAPLPWEFPLPVLACGGELKVTVCLGRGRQAILSHHLGDLENYATYCAFLEAVEHLGRLFDVQPRVIAHDQHPEYLSTKWALDQEGVTLIGVQHHHAHIVSCMAEHGHTEPVLGVAFDGLGYGPDGTMWGGEFLLSELGSFQRLGHLAPVPLPGGAAAVREPWRMVAAYLPGEGSVRRRHPERWDAVVRLASSAVHTTSVGRLFDAASALLGVRDTVTYEGQAAIELEQLADLGEQGSYPVVLLGDQPFCVDGAAPLLAMADELSRGADPVGLAARFHNWVADLVLEGCRHSRAVTGLSTVALSGGVFQNALLLERSVQRLEGSGFRVLCHQQVPANDGGLSLGQAVVAASLGSTFPG